MKRIEAVMVSLLVVLAIAGLYLAVFPEEMLWTFSADDYLSSPSMGTPLRVPEDVVRVLGVLMCGFGLVGALVVKHFSQRYREESEARGIADDPP